MHVLIDNIKKQRGFTLLELLLVLALVTALTVAGLSAYKIQLRNFKVDKTALQMQQWLQAGMAFYIDCGQWPQMSAIGPNNGDPNIIPAMMGLSPLTAKECPKYANQTRQYMPRGSDLSPWPGNYYQIYPNDASNPKDSKLFLVRVGISGVPADQVTVIANMIAGRLPYGEVPVPYLVTGAVNIPGQASDDAGKFKVMDMQVLNTEGTQKGQKSHIKVLGSNDCPARTHPEIFYSLSNIDAGEHALVYSGTNKSDVQLKQKDGFYGVDIGVYLYEPWPIRSRVNDGNNQALLISACVPDSSKNQQTLTTGLNQTQTNVRY